MYAFEPLKGFSLSRVIILVPFSLLVPVGYVTISLGMQNR